MAVEHRFGICLEAGLAVPKKICLASMIQWAHGQLNWVASVTSCFPKEASRQLSRLDT